MFACHWPHMRLRCQCLRPRGWGLPPPSGPSRTPWCTGPRPTDPRSSQDWAPAWSGRTWCGASCPQRIRPRGQPVWGRSRSERSEWIKAAWVRKIYLEYLEVVVVMCPLDDLTHQVHIKGEIKNLNQWILLAVKRPSYIFNCVTLKRAN